MKTLLFLLISTIAFAGDKSDTIKKLAGIREEILERQRVEFDKKYLSDLTRLLNSFPKDNLEDQIVVQREIWKIKFLGEYYSKNNKPYVIRIQSGGVVYRPSDGAIGNWKLEGEFFRVTLGEWCFVLPANQEKNYLGDLFWRGGFDKKDGLIRK